ncbi:MAG: tetratricopeptide repeat protein [Longimicrobiales bacterium]
MDPEREIENSNINLEFGGTFVLIGQLDSAAAVFSKLLTGSRDQRARGLRSLAFLSMYRGHYAEAVRDLVEATRLNRLSQTSTSEVRNRLLLATSLAQRGLLAESTEQLDSAFALSARFDADPILMFWLGKALARTGDIRRAEQVLALLDARRHPSNASAFAASEALKGEILTGQGTPHVALAHLESALSKDSSSAALESLAYAVARAGELERARLLYEELSRGVVFGHEAQKAWRLVPLWLGELAEQSGDRPLAVREYDRFLETWRDAEPSLPILLEVRRRLIALRGARG